jgi:hypothetical protein
MDHVRFLHNKQQNHDYANVRDFEKGEARHKKY